LLRPYGTGFDAETVLAVGRRPWVDLTTCTLPPDSVLLVFLGPLREDEPTGPPERWREFIGYSTTSGLDPQQTVDCYRAWWRIRPEQRAGIRAIVAVLGTVVVSLAVTAQERGTAVYDLDHRGFVRYSAVPAGQRDRVGRALHTSFAGRRWPSRPGAVSLVIGGRP
jgi:hypothetical protein